MFPTAGAKVGAFLVGVCSRAWAAMTQKGFVRFAIAWIWDRADRETSIVYGMRRAAFATAVADRMLPLGDIAAEIAEAIGRCSVT